MDCTNEFFPTLIKLFTLSKEILNINFKSAVNLATEQERLMDGNLKDM